MARGGGGLHLSDRSWRYGIGAAIASTRLAVLGLTLASVAVSAAAAKRVYRRLPERSLRGRPSLFSLAPPILIRRRTAERLGGGCHRRERRHDVSRDGHAVSARHDEGGVERMELVGQLWHVPPQFLEDFTAGDDRA